VSEATDSIMMRFHSGSTFAALLERTREDDKLWEALYKRARLSDNSVARVKLLRRRWHLLILNEDWCGDSVNVIPYVARLKEASAAIDMRIISRDANPDIMNSHLTGGSRSIPVVIALDDTFTERGWWGPRPGPLQTWVVAEGLALEKPERYRQVRTWYARDRGETLIDEIVSIMEQAEAADEKAAD